MTTPYTPIPLEELTPTDDQAVFNFVAHHLLTQGKKSVDEFYSCRYRGNDCLQCALGCLMDDAAARRFETLSLHEGSRNAVTLHFEALGYTIPLLEQLQEVHDKHDVELWSGSLNRVAERFSLDPFPSLTAEEGKV